MDGVFVALLPAGLLAFSVAGGFVGAHWPPRPNDSRFAPLARLWFGVPAGATIWLALFLLVAPLLYGSSRESLD